MQGDRILGDNEECRVALLNLVLTGVATPYLHNSTIYYDSNGESLVKYKNFFDLENFFIKIKII